MENIDIRDDDIYWLGHRERLRRRAALEGFDALRPYEIIELILCYAVPRVDMSGVARALIAELGSVEGVIRAGRDRLMAVEGVTPRMADWLLMTSGMVRSYAQVEYQRQFRVWCFRDMMKFIVPDWQKVPAPQVRVIYADYDDRIMCYMKLTDSLYWMDSICYREIMENALAMEAKYVYLVAFVGLEPLEITSEELEAIGCLSGALESIEMRLMDYILIGEYGIFSMRADGHMDTMGDRTKAALLRERYCGDGDDDVDGWNREIPEGEPGAV